MANQAPYAEIRSQALSKWKACQSNIYEEEKNYSLVYEDGNQALFLPGTKEFFHLEAIQRGDRERVQTDCFVFMH